MPLYVNTNVSSLNAQRQLISSGNQLDQAFERLSSGFRINSAADDAAGLQISNRLGSQIEGLNQGNRNANDGISVAQTAEGALQESSSILQRMRTLAIQSENGLNSSEDKAAIQKEIGVLQDELTRIADTTSFGGEKLLNADKQKTFQVGANANETISFALQSTKASDIGAFQQDLISNPNQAGTADVTATASGSVVFGQSGETDTLTLSNGISAKGIADQINGFSNTDISATAKNNAIISGFTSPAGADATVNLNGTSITVGQGSSLADFADTLNENSDTTGVRADLVGNELRLTGIEGEDIDFDTVDATSGLAFTIQGANSEFEVQGSTAAVSNGNDAFIKGTVELSSTSDFTVDTSGATNAGAIDNSGGTLSNVGSIDLSKEGGGQSAIDVIDSAIAQIDSFRADLGAAQNRFQATIRNQANISENLSEAQSRIKDADFASETAKLTQAQILQQASQTILAQANQRPQAALSLLG